MRSFTLTFDEDGPGEPKRIEFDSYDPARAFNILEREAIGKKAILWEDGQRLATLKRTKVGGWQLSS